MWYTERKQTWPTVGGCGRKLTFEGCLSGFQRVLILAVSYLTPYECMLCAVVNLQHLWGSLSLCSSDALLVPSEYKGSGLASILSHVSHSDGTFLCSRKKQTLSMNWELSMLLPFVSWLFYSVDRIWEKQGRGGWKLTAGKEAEPLLLFTWHTGLPGDSGKEIVMPCLLVILTTLPLHRPGEKLERLEDFAACQTPSECFTVADHLVLKIFEGDYPVLWVSKARQYFLKGPVEGSRATVAD